MPAKTAILKREWDLAISADVGPAFTARIARNLADMRGIPAEIVSTPWRKA